MKKAFSILLCVFFMYASYALMLPDGTEALVSAITEENGTIIAATLLESECFNTSVGTIELTAAAFYASGSLKAGILAKPQVIQDENGKVKVRDDITFYENGNIQSILFSDPQVIHIQPGYLRVSDELFFYENGALFSAYLSHPQLIQTPIAPLTFAQTIYFYESGSIGSGTFTTPQKIDTSVGTIDIDSIACYESGSLLIARLNTAQAVRTSTGTLSAEGEIHFYENGTLQLLMISQPTIINEIKYKEKSYIVFSEDGECMGEAVWN